MKQNLLLRAGLVISLAMLNLGLIAQTNTIAFASIPSIYKVSPAGPSPENKEVSAAGTILVEKKFGKVNHLQLFTDQNFQTAYFQKDDKQVRAVFNPKGKFLYAISTYESLSSVPEKLMETLKNLYPNKTIHGVTELTGQNETAYRVVLKEPESMLTVQWMDGEIKEVQKLYQQK